MGDRQTCRKYCYIAKKEFIEIKIEFWENKCNKIDWQLKSKSRTHWETTKTL